MRWEKKKTVKLLEEREEEHIFKTQRSRAELNERPYHMLVRSLDTGVRVSGFNF